MILLTGASGFIGNVLSKYLENHKFEVRKSFRRKINDEDFQLDLEKISEIKNSCKKIHTVIHLASLDFSQSEKNFKKAKKINFIATKKLYEEALNNNVKNFIYFSTAHIYGENLNNHVTELIMPKPISNYAKTHYMSEDFLINNFSKNEIKTTILRISNIVGNPQSNKLDKWKYVANDFCLQAIKNKKIVLLTDGSQKRDFYSIDSLVETVKNIVQSKDNTSNVYNLGSGNSMSILQLAQIIKKECKLLFDMDIEINYGNKQDKIQNLFYDVKKIKSSNLYTYDYSISESIISILTYWKKNFNSSI